MYTDYNVYEFTAFMDRYLKEHPEVVLDQQLIWSKYWEPKKVDREEENTQQTGLRNEQSSPAREH